MSQQPNKSPNKPADNKSYTKNLVGFSSGLVLATLIIVAVLLMINSNSKKDFKPTTEPVLANNTPPTTETLTPNQTGINHASSVNVAQNQQPLSDNANSNPNDTATDTTNHTADAPNTKTETTVLPNPATQVTENDSPNETDTQFNEPPLEGNNEPTFVAPPKTNVKPREQQPARRDTPKQQPKQTTKTTPAPKPTPQQILDSGNIEKAREVAKREQNSGSKKGGSVVLQAGSFNSRDYAESQRAKLAMLGVQAQISEATVNGKTVYRVQTPKLNADKANDAKAVMRLNGVGVYERHVQ